uniref:Uncharacterized protein n=1 Tax=Knipowitschia caucasica TaxID=637954 RepID=A0AAV2MF39_KNICA
MGLFTNSKIENQSLKTVDEELCDGVWDSPSPLCCEAGPGPLPSVSCVVAPGPSLISVKSERESQGPSGSGSLPPAAQSICDWQPAHCPHRTLL